MAGFTFEVYSSRPTGADGTGYIISFVKIGESSRENTDLSRFFVRNPNAMRLANETGTAIVCFDTVCKRSIKIGIEFGSGGIETAKSAEENKL